MILSYFLELVFIFVLLVGNNSFAFSQQRIKDFYLSNWQKDEKIWEVKGREATVYEGYIDIDKMQAKYFLKERTIDIKSEKARLYKPNMDIFLKDKVFIQTSDGIKLFAKSLEWREEKKLLKTDEEVKVKRDQFSVNAEGLEASTQLEKINFQKNVEVKLPDKVGNMITITCKGPLEINYNEGKAVFNNEVVMESKEGRIESDRAIVYFSADNKSIIKIVCEDNVRIKKDGNVTFSDKAIYFAEEKKIILEGRPRLIIFPQK